MQNKLLKIINIFIVAIFCLSLLPIKTSKAAATPPPTTSEVYQTTPPGIAMKDFVSKADTYKDGTVNSAKFFEAGNTTYDNSTDIYQLLSSDGGQEQTSSFWGKLAGDDGSSSSVNNYFDLSKPQIISAWLYMGDKNAYSGSSDDTADNLPDGLAFVLQDDTRGTQAIATSVNEGKTAFGEGLGVWGVASSSDNTLSKFIDPSLGAIQNSWALEFDTLQNSSPAASGSNYDDYFDGLTYSGVKIAKGQHMAWDYPANSGINQNNTSANMGVNPNDSGNTYYGKNNNWGNIFTGYKNHYYYGLNHRDVIHSMYLTGYTSASATNVYNSWHHFKLSYTPPAAGSTLAKMSYIFNDKTYDGTLKSYLDYDKKTNVTVDIGKFMRDGNTKVRWGFTASTGSQNSSPSTFAVIMQQMPNVANIETTTKLYDLSQYDTAGNLGREIKDLDKRPVSITAATKDPDYNVANGDKLRLDYNLKYTSGFEGTGSDITTNVNLPLNIDFSPDEDNNIGQIIYSGFSDESKNRTVPISATSLTNANKVALSLDALDSENENIKIEFFGTADAQTTPTTVKGQHASYQSLHFMDDIMSPSFIINDRLQLTTNDSLDLGTIQTGNESNNQVNLNLTMNYLNNSNFDTKGVTLYTKVDDKTATRTTISTTDGKTSYDIADDIANSTQFSADYLGTGTHTITVYVVDSMNRVSQSITYQVKVEGKQLKLDVDPNYSFKDINKVAPDGYVERKGHWKVSVISSDTPWTLTANGTELTLKDDSSQVIGPMFYRDKNDNDFSMLNQDILIAQDTSSDSKTTDVSGSWDNDDGILLHDDQDNVAGKYQGQIHWSLIDSV